MEIRHYRQAKTLSAIERLGQTRGAPHCHSDAALHRPQVWRARHYRSTSARSCWPAANRCAFRSIDAGRYPEADEDLRRSAAARQQCRRRSGQIPCGAVSAHRGRRSAARCRRRSAARRRLPAAETCAGHLLRLAEPECLPVGIAGAAHSRVSAEAARAKVDHEAGRKVPVAHSVEIDPDSRLAQIVAGSAIGRTDSRSSCP